MFRISRVLLSIKVETVLISVKTCIYDIKVGLNHLYLHAQNKKSP